MREVVIVGSTKRRYRFRIIDSIYDQPKASYLLRDMPLPDGPNKV